VWLFGLSELMRGEVLNMLLRNTRRNVKFLASFMAEVGLATVVNFLCVIEAGWGL